MTSTNLLATSTTWLDSTSPSRAFYGKTGYLALHASSPTRWGVVYFAWPFGPDQTVGANVLKATLQLRTRKMTSTGSRTITAQLIDQPHSVRYETWTTRPQRFRGAAVSLAKSGALPENTLWELDVTALMQTVADAGSFWGFVLTTNAGGAETPLVQANMSAAVNPRLVVEWTTAPKPPDALAPSAARAVAPAKPTLRWSFYDHAGAESLQSIQVQTSKTGNFSTPAWDSGEIPTHWCSLDLSTTSFPAPSPGGVTYWRVRNRDTAGLWSAWSIATSWTYRPGPVAALQNPSSATPYVVDPTPPIDWTYSSPSGSPQSAYRVGIYVWNPTRGWILVDQSGLLKGTATSWTSPQPLKWPNATYRVAVDVFDGYTREATPGDPGFYSDTEDVEFKPSGSQVSAQTIRAESDYLSPLVRVRWTNTQQPDSWVIYRDGVQVATFRGSSTLVGDTAPNYGWDDKACPNGTHTWAIVGIVNGGRLKAATVTAEVRHIGTWLVDEETGQQVCIQNDKTHDVKFGEVSSVHEVLGSSRVVLVTEALRGYEGTIEGGLYWVTGLPKDAASTWRRNLLDFKSNPGRELRLVLEDQTFPVNIKDVQVAGDPSHPGEWAASFAFWQMGELPFDADVAGNA